MHFSFWEKLGFGVLTAAWVAFGSNFVGNALIHAEPLEKAAYQVALPDAATTESASTEGNSAENALVMLASADPEQGEKVFKKCKACHSAEEGAKHKIGPNLWDVVGRAKAGTDWDGYSAALKAKGGDWTYADLDQFIAKPKDFVPKTKMSFAGIKDAADRAALLVMMRSLSAAPKPLP